MYIIYNKDGSIKKKNFAEFIQKGNNNANFIFVGIDGLDLTDYSCYATFELPNGDLGGPVAGVPIVEFSDELPYSGYNIPVTAEMTQYEGQLKLSLHIENSQGAVMYTYPVILVINDATAAPDQTKISLSQYQALLNLINSKPVPTSNLFFTVVNDISAIPEEEWAKYSVGKIFYDKKTKNYYIKDITNSYALYNMPVFSSPILSDTNDITLIGKTKKVGMRAVDGENTATPLGQFNVYQDTSNPSGYIAHMFAKGSDGGYYGIQVGEEGIKYEYPFTDSSNPLHPVVTQREEPIEKVNLVEVTGTSGTLDSNDLAKINKDKCFIVKDKCLYIPVGLYALSTFPNLITGKKFICITRRENNLIIQNPHYFTFDTEEIGVNLSTGAWTYTKKSDDLYSKTIIDNNFRTIADSYSKSEVNALVTGAVEFKGTVADLTALNAIQNPSSGNMYWVTSENQYYIYNGTQWSAAGGTVDLSNYYTKAESDTKYVTLSGDQTISGEKTILTGPNEAKLNFVDSSCYITGQFGAAFGFVIHDIPQMVIALDSIRSYTIVPINDMGSSLGTSSKRWSNLYVSGNISDGTNATTIENIVTKTGAQTISGVKTLSNGIKIENSTVSCYSQIIPGQNSLDFYFKETSGTLEKLFSLYGQTRTGQTTLYHAIFDVDYLRPEYNDYSSLGDTDHRWKDLWLSGNLYINSLGTQQNPINNAYFNELKVAEMVFKHDSYDGAYTIGVYAGNTGLRIGSNALQPLTNTNSMDLGTALNPWKDIYLSGEIHSSSGDAYMTLIVTATYSNGWTVSQSDITKIFNHTGPYQIRLGTEGILYPNKTNSNGWLEYLPVENNGVLEIWGTKVSGALASGESWGQTKVLRSYTLTPAI